MRCVSNNIIQFQAQFQCVLVRHFKAFDHRKHLVRAQKHAPEGPLLYGPGLCVFGAHTQIKLLLASSPLEMRRAGDSSRTIIKNTTRGFVLFSVFSNTLGKQCPELFGKHTRKNLIAFGVCIDCVEFVQKFDIIILCFVFQTQWKTTISKACCRGLQFKIRTLYKLLKTFKISSSSCQGRFDLY